MLVKLLVHEPGSHEAARLWLVATHVVSSRLAYVEARSALARALRSGRLTERRMVSRKARLEALTERIAFAEIATATVALAADLAEDHALRAHDAIHLATAVALGIRELVVASWNAELRRAAAESGFAIAPAQG